MELLAPSHGFTAFQLTRACLNPMADFLGRGLDATANTLPFFSQFDEKILNTVATLMGHGKEWPTGGTAHLERDAWQLAAERIRLPKRHGGLGIPAATSKCPVGRTAAVIDCVRLGLKGVHAKNQDSRNPAPARTPLFPSSILDSDTEDEPSDERQTIRHEAPPTIRHEHWRRLREKLGHVPTTSGGRHPERPAAC